MENRITTFLEESPESQENQKNDAHPIGEVLEELFAQYQARFPDIEIIVSQTPISAI